MTFITNSKKKEQVFPKHEKAENLLLEDAESLDKQIVFIQLSFFDEDYMK